MAKLPNKIQDIVDKKQAYIDNNRDKLESSVIKMQEELLKQFIEKIIPEIETKDGQILNTTKNMQLIEKLDSLYSQFNNTTQTKVVQNLGESLVGLNKFNKDNFGEIVLNEVTSKRFDSVVKNTNLLMSTRLGITNIGEVKTGGFLDSFITDNTLLTELKKSIIQNVTGQQSMANFTENIKKTIVGTDKVSGGFEKYYRQFAYDTYQEYDRAYGKTMADEFKLDYAVYQGGLIKDSREFCIVHEDKVFTRPEIDDFDKWTLPKGSKESPGEYEVPSYIADFPNYDPYTHCGGFNCRHQLTWITKSMAERLRPDLKQVKKQEEVIKPDVKPDVKPVIIPKKADVKTKPVSEPIVKETKTIDYQKELDSLKQQYQKANESGDYDKVGIIMQKVGEINAKILQQTPKAEKVPEIAMPFKTKTLDGSKKEESYYNDQKAKLFGKVDKSIEKSIDNYIEESTSIAVFLRTGKLEGKTTKKDIANIDKLFENEHSKLNDNLELKRVVGFEQRKFFDNLKEGDIFEDASYVSTTLSGKTYNFIKTAYSQTNKDVLNIKILAKKGSKAAPIDFIYGKENAQFEYLLPRGSQFKIISKKNNDLIIELL